MLGGGSLLCLKRADVWCGMLRCALAGVVVGRRDVFSHGIDRERAASLTLCTILREETTNDVLARLPQ